MTTITCPVFRLYLLGLAAIQVVSSATTVTNPLPTLGPRKNYSNSITDSKGRPPIVQRERLGNGTLSYYSWLEDPSQIDATLDDDNDNNNNSSNGRLEKGVRIRRDDKDSKDPEGQKHEEAKADLHCIETAWVCDPQWNHAFAEACDILIADNLHNERRLPPWTYSLCYALDWDYWGDYQCCASWNGLMRTDFNTSDLLPVTEELFKRCTIFQERLKYHVVSGRAIHVSLGGACVSQCLSNRNEHCE